MRHYICCTDELPDGGSYMRVVADAETFESAQYLYNQVSTGPEGHRMHLISKEDYDKNYNQEGKGWYQKKEEVRETTENIVQNKTETMTEEELIRITIKVALIAADMDTDLNPKKDQNVTDEFVEDLSNRVSALERSLRTIMDVGEKHANQLQSIIDRNEKSQKSKAVRGKYRKKLKPNYGESKFTKTGERKTVVVQKNVSGNIFGAKTTSKYNKAITKALNAKSFTSAEIIAEVRRKHAKVHRFSGKELLYQVKKAKWRLDSRRRRDEGIGVYANKPVTKKEIKFSTNKGFTL